MAAAVTPTDQQSSIIQENIMKKIIDFVLGNRLLILVLGLFVVGGGALSYPMLLLVVLLMGRRMFELKTGLKKASH